MKKKTLIIFVIILIALAGIVWFFLAPIEKPEGTSTPEGIEAPVLFSKEDYKVVERDGEQYLDIEKIGFSAKIPEDWKIEQVGEKELPCLVHLLSPDAEILGTLRKGCGITIAAGTAEEQLAEIETQILAIKKEAEKSIETQEGYLLELINIGGNEALKWTAPKKPSLGQALGINVLLSNGRLLSMDTRLPEGYEEICKPTWEAFIHSIEIR